MNEKNLGGIGKSSRRQLASVVDHLTGGFKAADVAGHLQISKSKARWLLSDWAKKNWIKRIRPGLYLATETAAESAKNILIDSWVIATQLFSPCYIGGWSASEHWGLTDQIFSDLVILTTKKFNHKTQFIGNMSVGGLSSTGPTVGGQLKMERK